MEYVDELEGISNESHCIGPECAYIPSANAVIICTDNIYQTLHHLIKDLMYGIHLGTKTENMTSVILCVTQRPQKRTRSSFHFQ